MSSSTFYAVSTGHQPGIYEDWPTTSQQVTGYPGAAFKRFRTREEAQHYLHTNIKEETCENLTTRLETLTEKQRLVLHHLLLDRNVALLGAAGCGKSYLLSVIYTDFPGLKKRYTHSMKLPRIQICAMTGCAALLLGHKAKTLHSWAGIGLGKGTVQELYTKIRRNTKSMRHWLCTDLLIIDEVSMMTAELLDKLHQLAQRIRGNKKPFGGMQVLLVGDFYQLPPVNKSEEATVFAFESDAWKEIIDRNGKTVELTEIQRQKDPVFQTILTEARLGALGSQSCAILRECQDRDWKTHKIRPTLIFPRRAEVDMINDSNLRALKGRRYTYKARLVYDGKMPDEFSEKEESFQQALKHYDSNAAYLVDLELALNAQVMLIANAFPDQGLVNGSRGVIVEFCSQTELPIVEFVNGVRRMIGHHAWPIEDYEFISRSQIPLRLAYAATTHKVQGATLDAALIDIGSGIFEYGQAYVALSRVRSLDALYVHDFDPTAFRVHPKVIKFYQNLTVSEVEEENVLDNLKKSESDPSTRSIMAEPSKVIRGITGNKLDAMEPVEPVDPMEPMEPMEPVDSAGQEPVEPFDSEEPGASLASNWLYDSIPVDWKPSLSSCEGKLLELSQFLSNKDFLPSKDHVWAALALTSLKDIKVVILGQDPYPTLGNPTGLAFSVSSDVKPLPGSLKNIYKELTTDLGVTPPSHGSLESWAKQGILLLNTVLTVEQGAPQSHSKIGWEEVTDQIIRSVAAQTEGTIFVLWGKSAQAKKKLLDLYLQKNKHRIFESTHPSPLSAHRGFFGSRPFSTINQWLIETGKSPITW